MGRALADRSRAARETFEEADAVLGWSVSGLAWQGPEERLNDTRFTQPCLFTTSLAALAALRERVQPSAAFVAGHSVGEYAALVAAGVLSFADGLRLVARRGELMSAGAASGGMTAVIGLDRETVASVVASVASPADLVVANDNAPGQVVISGTRAAIDKAPEIAKTLGIKRAMALNVSAPFHSPMMQPAADKMREALAAVTIRPSAVPVVANVTAAENSEPETIRRLLVEQVTGRVRWRESVLAFRSLGVETTVEFGGGKVLTGMVKRIEKDLQTVTLDTPADIEAFAKTL
jgi:[acyl-carrier-protein] S-malonyltransferase